MKNFKLLTVLALSLSFLMASGQSESADTTYSFIHVDVPALFPGCENLKGVEQRICSNETLDAYIENIKEYPKEATRRGTKGKCVIEYTVTADGEMKDIELTRDIGDGCGEEALRIFNKMKEDRIKWLPGTKEGENVSVRMKTVVSFFPGHRGVFTPMENKRKQEAKAFGNIRTDR